MNAARGGCNPGARFVAGLIESRGSVTVPYIDCSVMAVPEAEKEAYLAHARAAEAIILETGAIGVIDAWGDDVAEGKVTDYRRAVKARADETVVVGWIIWPDKATRDAGWKTLTQDDRLRTLERPFDGERMILGGFEVLNGS